jgi:S-DNA-T family DNA segregation ATPase FtsK/SpoIIIE
MTHREKFALWRANRDKLAAVKAAKPVFEKPSTPPPSPSLELLQQVRSIAKPACEEPVKFKEIKEPFKVKEEPVEIKTVHQQAKEQLQASALQLLKKAKAKAGITDGKYIIPGIELLTPGKAFDPKKLEGEIAQQSKLLEETLLSFGIEAKVGQVHIGPRLLSFEVHPAIGVKVQRIKALEDDIALNLQAKSIRIIAPIPGKAAVGIEVPTKYPQEVNFRSMIEQYQKQDQKYAIPVILGKTVSGEDVHFDLTKMPHMIIAGATGSGKSVCVNTIIMSILLHANADDIKLLMVDPKKVELTPYSKLPHMIAPVITEPPQAAEALRWLVVEMERRYEILKRMGLRHIQAFNERQRDEAFESSLGMEIPVKMPYIVGIIDELADLMMTSPGDIETPIARIAQMARAVGIHMILATQRPSREVITGLIKANFPGRIAFKVASRVNSQIILDETGADCLLGNGDMLFLHPSKGSLMRAQGAFIRDEDINRVIETIEMQAPPNYLLKPDLLSEGVIGHAASLGAAASEDELFETARQLITETGTASTTFLQRKLRIGYARAASLMDELEAHGIVSSSENGKPRRVLIGKEEELENQEV